MEGGQSTNVLPNYYDVLNVAYHSSPHDVPEAFYRLMRDPEAKKHYGQEAFNAYDCLSNPVDRTSYNEFYFNTPVWYSKPLWIAYRNERRRLEEKQLRHDREAREQAPEQAPLALVKATATPTSQLNGDPLCEIDIADTSDIVDTVDTPESTESNLVTEAEDGPTVDQALSELTTKIGTGASAEVSIETLAEVSMEVSTKKKKRTRRRGVKRSAARNKITEEEKTLLEKTDIVEVVVDKGGQNGQIDYKGDNGNDSGKKVSNKASDKAGNNTGNSDHKIAGNNTNKTNGERARNLGKMLARSRWADPNICSDGLTGHPHESWEVKAGIVNCMNCKVSRCGSILRCVKCSTVFCNKCYTKTTTVRQRNVEAAA
ncbi:hypothetical protein SEUCBS139899_008679 [Sporothrix eucalyptigena]|uniref:J domain-containing protein n=1 Tax=Sporothrix eucalyptigena TaxID=1812306 RepID=A0ABP0CNT1_9PEZI